MPSRILLLLVIGFPNQPVNTSSRWEQKEPPQTKDREDSDSQPSSEQVKKLIDALASLDFAERNLSTKKLAALGEKVLPALKEAAKNHIDPEARRRAQQLVDRLTPDELDQLVKKAAKTEELKQYKEAVALWEKVTELGKARLSPGTAAPSSDIPFLTDAFLHLARMRRKLDDHEKAADAYGRAEYYSNFNNNKRAEIDKEWHGMVNELLKSWESIVAKRIKENGKLRAITMRYPVVLLHSRRYAEGGYIQSAFSFNYETSDVSKHKNDVQFLFDNGGRDNTFSFNCLLGQENRVVDLGQVDFTRDPDPATISGPGGPEWSTKKCKATDGHVYLEEIKDKRGNHFFVIFQILATDKDSRYVAFVWRKLPGGKVVKSP
jgi:tetratricopeptide (TPR) repeat protein